MGVERRALRFGRMNIELLAQERNRPMSPRPALAFACAHLTDERLFAHAVAALGPTHDCSSYVFRDHDTLGAMADEILERMPARFTLIGLSLGGYVASITLLLCVPFRAD